MCILEVKKKWLKAMFFSKKGMEEAVYFYRAEWGWFQNAEILKGFQRILLHTTQLFSAATSFSSKNENKSVSVMKKNEHMLIQVHH